MHAMVSTRAAGHGHVLQFYRGAFAIAPAEVDLPLLKQLLHLLRTLWTKFVVSREKLYHRKHRCKERSWERCGE